jgi:PAS domain S-box-containing protein
MENNKRNNLYSIPSPKFLNFCDRQVDSEQMLPLPDILSQAAIPIDLSLIAKQDNPWGKYEDLLHQIDDLLAESVEHSNQVLSETQIDYLILNQIFNASNNGICAIDREHTILRINKKLLELLGKPIKEVIGKKCYDIFEDCEAYRSRRECQGDQIFHGETLVERQTTMASANGERIPVAVVSTPLLGLDGSKIGLVETFVDINNRMNATKLPDIAASEDLATKL